MFGKTQRENNAYFEKLIAECNYHYEDLRPLFPSLPPIETRDNNNNSNHRTSYSSTSSSSSAAYSSRQPSLNHIRDYKETQRASYGTASRTVYQSENAHHHGRGGTQEVVSRGVTYFPRGNDRSSSGPSRDTRRDYSYGRHSY